MKWIPQRMKPLQADEVVRRVRITRPGLVDRYGSNRRQHDGAYVGGHERGVFHTSGGCERRLGYRNTTCWDSRGSNQWLLKHWAPSTSYSVGKIAKGNFLDQRLLKQAVDALAVRQDVLRVVADESDSVVDTVDQLDDLPESEDTVAKECSEDVHVFENIKEVVCCNFTSQLCIEQLHGELYDHTETFAWTSQRTDSDDEVFVVDLSRARDVPHGEEQVENAGIRTASNLSSAKSQAKVSSSNHHITILLRSESESISDTDELVLIDLEILSDRDYRKAFVCVCYNGVTHGLFVVVLLDRSHK